MGLVLDWESVHDPPASTLFLQRQTFLVPSIEFTSYSHLRGIRSFNPELKLKTGGRFDYFLGSRSSLCLSRAVLHVLRIDCGIGLIDARLVKDRIGSLLSDAVDLALQQVVHSPGTRNRDVCNRAQSKVRQDDAASMELLRWRWVVVRHIVQNVTRIGRHQNSVLSTQDVGELVIDLAKHVLLAG